MKNSAYQNPLTGRYASKEMSFNWSPQKKHATWRRLWLALAQCEKELGLNISEKQIEQMAAHLDDIDFDAVAVKEKELRHDVMSNGLLKEFVQEYAGESELPEAGYLGLLPRLSLNLFLGTD